MSATSMKQELAAAAARKGLAAMPKVLFAASECAPFSRAGERADVIGTLPKYLRRLGFDVRIIIPYHRQTREKYADKIEFLFSFDIYPGGRKTPVGVYRTALERVPVWLIENEEYFSGPVYDPAREGEQYAYFTRAVLEALPRLDFLPDIIHCHDWHTGMIPLLLKTQYIDSPLSRTKSFLTIHNIACQRLCSFAFVQKYLSVPDGCFGLMDRAGQADFLKAGCVMADRVCTVSPAYARAICTPEHGGGLDGDLSFRGDVRGIVNGVDRAVWNPARDRALPVTFSASRLFGKLQCKTALLPELGLEILPGRPLIGMVTSLTGPKGLDLVTGAMDGLLAEQDFAFVLLGRGVPDYERRLDALQSRWPGRVCFRRESDDGLIHRVFAGCDFLLMPSLMEPCGLVQLIAMAYGTLPIVHEAGGLRDTVRPYDPITGDGDGFVFSRYDAGAMAGAVGFALETYRKKPLMEHLAQNAMTADHGCDKWAYAYGLEYLDML